MMSLEDGFCPICDQEMYAFVSGYRTRPFIDGRRYEGICPVCNDVPKMYDYNEETGEFVFYDWPPKKLKTIEEMVEDGWSKDESRTSIKAVRAAMKKKPGKELPVEQPPKLAKVAKKTRKVAFKPTKVKLKRKK